MSVSDNGPVMSRQSASWSCRVSVPLPPTRSTDPTPLVIHGMQLRTALLRASALIIRHSVGRIQIQIS